MDLPETVQDLPPRWAHFYLEVEAFVFRELGLDLAEKKLLIALSGGVDSTALLILARIFQKRWGNDLIAAHLNHKLRPDADLEEQENKKLCEKLSLPHYIGRSNVAVYSRKLNLGLEQGARKLRYSFLNSLCRKHACDFILTAHHLNDLAEDFLLRQLRGAGWPSIAGMQAHEPESGILRPFLLFPKQELQGLVEYTGLSWQEDESNLDTRFKRNRMREEILPLFCRENPNFLQRVKQLWRQARLDQDYWEEQLREKKNREKQSSNSCYIARQALEECHPALRLRWYKDILSRLGSGQVLAENLSQLDAAWQNGTGGKVIQFPGNKRAKIVKKGILFYLQMD